MKFPLRCLILLFYLPFQGFPCPLSIELMVNKETKPALSGEFKTQSPFAPKLSLEAATGEPSFDESYHLGRQEP